MRSAVQLAAALAFDYYRDSPFTGVGRGDRIIVDKCLNGEAGKAITQSDAASASRISELFAATSVF